MIDLERRDGAVLRIGHRGAAALAPENTLRSFRAALAHAVDLIEFDVLDLPRGPLVLAHSDRLDEVSHGRATGSVRERSLEELRDVAPELPTFEEALAFFVDEAPALGLHVDLKLTARLEELAGALRRHGLERRTVVSSFHVPSLRAVAREAPSVRIGFTYPEDRYGVSRRRALRPVLHAGLKGYRAAAPTLVPRLAARAGATALMLQHALVTPRAVARARALGAPVLAWTVDDPAELRRVVQAGVAGVITNDPRIFASIGT
ncbi:MAG: glycerophosphodiester phosphodiesterase [Gaiella sp.]|nr:glycerophosphodiester phosphodiesterase [Gaiella sp.]